MVDIHTLLWGWTTVPKTLDEHRSLAHGPAWRSEHGPPDLIKKPTPYTANLNITILIRAHRTLLADLNPATSPESPRLFFSGCDTKQIHLIIRTIHGLDRPITSKIHLNHGRYPACRILLGAAGLHQYFGQILGRLLQKPVANDAG